MNINNNLIELDIEVEDYIIKNLEQRGYTLEEAIIAFYNEMCKEYNDPEKHKELLLRKEKLERCLKILTEDLEDGNKAELELEIEMLTVGLEDVNKEIELCNKKFKPYHKEIL